MRARKFILITFLTILYFILARIIGWIFLKDTRFWQRIISDNLHHYQLGLLFLLGGFLFFSKNSLLRDYLLAIGSGAIIDEAIYIFKFINPKFDHFHAFYSPHKFLTGVLFEFFVFIVFSIIVFHHKKSL